MTPASMGRPKTENSTQIAIRIPEDWTKRAAQLADRLSEPGMSFTATDIFRMAMAHGLRDLEERAERDAMLDQSVLDVLDEQKKPINIDAIISSLAKVGWEAAEVDASVARLLAQKKVQSGGPPPRQHRMYRVTPKR